MQVTPPTSRNQTNMEIEFLIARNIQTPIFIQTSTLIQKLFGNHRYRHETSTAYISETKYFGTEFIIIQYCRISCCQSFPNAILTILYINPALQFSLLVKPGFCYFTFVVLLNQQLNMLLRFESKQHVMILFNFELQFEMQRSFIIIIIYSIVNCISLHELHSIIRQLIQPNETNKIIAKLTN